MFVKHANTGFIKRYSRGRGYEDGFTWTGNVCNCVKLLIYCCIRLITLFIIEDIREQSFIEIVH